MEVALVPSSDLRRTSESGEFDGQDIARMEGTPYGARMPLTKPARERSRPSR